MTWQVNEYSAIVRELQCRSCGEEQSVRIAPRVRPPSEATEGEAHKVEPPAPAQRTRSGYRTSGVLSLDWVKEDPTSLMCV